LHWVRFGGFVTTRMVIVLPTRLMKTFAVEN